MAKNTLFNFLLQNEARLQLPLNYRVVLDLDGKGKQYYRIECPNETTVLHNKEIQYTLKNYHLSIYENENRENPNLSQYHLTAEFIDGQSKEYRAHIYFNAFDTNIKTTFELKTATGYKLIDSKNLQDQCTLFALTRIKTILKMLRNQHNETVSLLKTRYNQYDQELANCFDSEEKNTDQILEKIQQTCVVLNELIPLVRSSNYSQRLRFHETSAQLLRKFLSTLITQINPPELSGLPEKNESKSETIDALLHSTPQSSSSPEPRPLVSKFKSEYELLISELKQLTNQSIEAQAENIEQLLRKTYVLSLNFEDQIRFVELQQLQKLRRNLEIQGATLFIHLLEEHRFETAATLTSFHYLINENDYLDAALEANRPDFLEFILTYGEFDLDQPVTIGSTVYPSAVHACLGEDKATNPMGKCLAILVKHEASLLTLDSKGLPLVYPIFIDNKHPLWLALALNPEKTLNSYNFLSKFIILLRAYLTQSQLTIEEKTPVQLCVDNLEISNTQLKQLSQIPYSSFIRKRMTGLEVGPNHDLTPDTSETLSLRKKIVQEAVTIFPKFSKKQLRQSSHRVVNKLDQYDSQLNCSNANNDSEKTDVSEPLQTQYKYFQNLNHLLDLEKEIKNEQHKPLNRKMRQKAEEYIELVKVVCSQSTPSVKNQEKSSLRTYTIFSAEDEEITPEDTVPEHHLN